MSPDLSLKRPIFVTFLTVVDLSDSYSKQNIPTVGIWFDSNIDDHTNTQRDCSIVCLVPLRRFFVRKESGEDAGKEKERNQRRRWKGWKTSRWWDVVQAKKVSASLILLFDFSVGWLFSLAASFFHRSQQKERENELRLRAFLSYYIELSRFV